MDAVFKALADATRRDLLDELFRNDGQTHALEARFEMTRYGVMKHLRVLEDAVGGARNSTSRILCPSGWSTTAG